MVLRRDFQFYQQAHLGNAWWHRQLGAVADFPTPVSDAHVDALCELQERAHLEVDGILSPKVRAHLRQQPYIPPVDNTLLVANELIPVPHGVSAVSASQKDGFCLHPAKQAWRPRAKQSSEAIDLLVLHWDECESSMACFHTLLRRELSAHLLIDADGVVWQTLDLVEACAFHARIHNERSVGIEVQNKLVARRDGSKASQETVCESQAHTGLRWHITPFTAAQKRCVRLLVPWLCDVLGIAFKLPQTNNDVSEGLIEQPYQGVCGHYHLQRDKVDPGMGLWPLLRSP